jgi:hypothetical protein
MTNRRKRYLRLKWRTIINTLLAHCIIQQNVIINQTYTLFNGLVFAIHRWQNVGRKTIILKILVPLGTKCWLIRDKSWTLPTLHPYGTRIICSIVFYQHVVPNGTQSQAQNTNANKVLQAVDNPSTKPWLYISCVTRVIYTQFISAW